MSRTRFKTGALHGNTQRTKRTRNRTKRAIRETLLPLPKNQNPFLLWRLQIEMRRRVEPTQALIETTAHAKRCCFSLSRRNCRRPGNHANRQKPGTYSNFLILPTSFAYSSAYFSNRFGAAKVKTISGLRAANTSTLQAIVAPSTSPVPVSP